MTKSNKMDRKVYGNTGEDIACSYLKKQKYKILERNFTTPVGEMDIVAQKKKTIVIVEVKRRATDRFGAPSEAVNKHKQRKISQIAFIFLQQNGLLDHSARFDVIEVLGSEVNHIENAFECEIKY